METKIKIINNDLEIIDLITDAGIKHDDDNTNRVLTFFLNDNFHLLTYFATKGDKGFILFLIEDYRNNLVEFDNLLFILKEELKTGNNEFILKESIKQVEFISFAAKSTEIFYK
jgi:hypothetical protein